MRKNCFYTVGFAGLLMSTSLWAQGAFIAKVKVAGMVCSFCAQGLTKTFRNQVDVIKTDVSLDERTMLVYLREDSKLSKEDIAELVADAGYKADSIEISNRTH